MRIAAVTLLAGAILRVLATARLTDLGTLFGALGLVTGLVTLAVLILLYRRISQLVTQVEKVTQQRK